MGWSNFSDGRFKTNITPDVPGLEFILKLKPVTFNWDLQALEEFQGTADPSKGEAGQGPVDQ
ncbi:MAG: tail fiber domain-containing protein, partial [Bacteroidales bacterium]|nr:tail fiber domain-containing protein [Bacteroidales bacterium]